MAEKKAHDEMLNEKGRYKTVISVPLCVCVCVCVCVYIYIHTHIYMGFPGGASDKEPACQCRRHKR